MTIGEGIVYVIVALIISEGMCILGANIGEGLIEIAKSIKNKEE